MFSFFQLPVIAPDRWHFQDDTEQPVKDVSQHTQNPWMQSIWPNGLAWLKFSQAFPGLIQCSSGAVVILFLERCL